MFGRRLQRSVAGAVALLIATGTVSADDKTERADRLFEEGKAMLDNDLAAACLKFEESLQFNSQAIGTLLNVALCDEKLGRYASAVAKFGEARDRAKEQGMEVHRKAAEEHIQALAAKVPHLTLAFSEPPRAQTTIVIDDRLIPFSSIANHPVDPGAHDVVVSAPGHVAYKARFEIAAGEAKDLAIPPLQKSVSVQSSRRRIGRITTGAGIAAVGTGVVLGLVAKRKFDAATEDCNRITVGMEKVWQCESTGEARSAHTLGTVGTVVVGVGLVAVGVGAYLWLSGRGESERRVSVVPHVGPEGPGIAAVGRF
ncbi:MAG: hypothetical protein H0T42_15650 [Deltaproteobacteria bacterium]|nr:hypothetical protein [Deltaproteobacteria bacterium]